MKRLLLLFLMLGALAPAAFSQGTTQNPFAVSLNVQDAGQCSTVGSYAWQHLPLTAGTTVVTISGSFNATVTIRLSNNGGSNGGTWTTPLNGTLSGVGTSSYSTSGYTEFCADVTTYTSGAVQVSISTGTGGGGGGGSSATSTGAVSNGQWVQNGDVIWMQYTQSGVPATNSGIGSQTIHQSARILQTNGTSVDTTWDVVCNFSTNGGFGTGFTVSTAGWLQAATALLNSGNFPQGSVYVNIYILKSMPSGGGTGTCTNNLSSANIGYALSSAPSGSYFPISFVGTTGIYTSPWAIPGYSWTLQIANPAAGADWISPVFGVNGTAFPGRYCLVGALFKLVTSGTTANRNVALQVSFNSGAVQFVYPAATAQTATATQFYTLGPGESESVFVSGANSYHILPFNNGTPICFNSGAMNASGTVGSSTNLIQAGDQFSNITLLFQVQQDNN